jgi:hypothetical protein
METEKLVAHRLRYDCWLPPIFYRFLCTPVTFRVFFLIERPSLAFRPLFLPTIAIFFGVVGAYPISLLTDSIKALSSSIITFSSFLTILRLGFLKSLFRCLTYSSSFEGGPYRLGFLPRYFFSTPIIV